MIPLLYFAVSSIFVIISDKHDGKNYQIKFNKNKQIFNSQSSFLERRVYKITQQHYLLLFSHFGTQRVDHLATGVPCPSKIICVYLTFRKSSLVSLLQRAYYVVKREIN